MMNGMICPHCGKDTGIPESISYYGDLTECCPFCGAKIVDIKQPKIVC